MCVFVCVLACSTVELSGDLDPQQQQLFPLGI